MQGPEQLPVVAPMLAMLGPLPSGAGWGSEFKWDGVRTVTYVAAGEVRAVSRNQLDVTSQYPELSAMTAALRGRHAVLDGEVVALDPAGVPQFARLQQRIHVRAPSAALLAATPVAYYVFDVLALDGEPTMALPYHRRREVLEGLELVGQGLGTPPAFRDEPRVVYDAAVSSGLEGVVCKRLGSIYEPGRRSPDWIKVPVALTQEVVLIGWRPGEGRRSGMIGSLLLAVPHAQGNLAYAGKVGTGFTETALRDLRRRLEPIARTTAPIEGVPRAHARAAQWLEPTLVGEVTFRNWTPDGRLRHPSWRGLRPDRDPDDLARVQP